MFRGAEGESLGESFGCVNPRAENCPLSPPTPSLVSAPHFPPPPQAQAAKLSLVLHQPGDPVSEPKGKGGTAHQDTQGAWGLPPHICRCPPNREGALRLS